MYQSGEASLTIKSLIIISKLFIIYFTHYYKRFYLHCIISTTDSFVITLLRHLLPLKHLLSLNTITRETSNNCTSSLLVLKLVLNDNLQLKHLYYLCILILIVYQKEFIDTIVITVMLIFYILRLEFTITTNNNKGSKWMLLRLQWNSFGVSNSNTLNLNTHYLAKLSVVQSFTHLTNLFIAVI